MSGRPGAISQRVARAERDGLVERAVAGEGSRAVVVTLTAAGHELVERLVDRVLGREADLISCLTPHQQATLTGLLRLLLTGLQAQLGDQRPTQVGST